MASLERKDIQRCIELIRYCEDLTRVRNHPTTSRRLLIIALCIDRTMTSADIVKEMLDHFHADVAVNTIYRDIEHLCETGALKRINHRYKYTTNKDILL